MATGSRISSFSARASPGKLEIRCKGTTILQHTVRFGQFAQNFVSLVSV